MHELSEQQQRFSARLQVSGVAIEKRLAEVRTV